MIRNIKSRTMLHTAAVALMVAMTGCATQPVMTPQESVRLASSNYWALLMSGKFEKAYERVAPSIRKTVSYGEYRQSFGNGASWVSADVTLVDCSEPARCKARVQLAARPAIPGYQGTISAAHEETWSLEDGQWWLLPPKI